MWAACKFVIFLFVCLVWHPKETGSNMSVCVRLYQDSLCVNGSVGACVRVRVCAIKKVCVHVCGICLYYLKCAFFLHVCV